MFNHSAEYMDEDWEKLKHTIRILNDLRADSREFKKRKNGNLEEALKVVENNEKIEINCALYETAIKKRQEAIRLLLKKIGMEKEKDYSARSEMKRISTCSCPYIKSNRRVELTNNGKYFCQHPFDEDHDNFEICSGCEYHPDNSGSLLIPDSG